MSPRKLSPCQAELYSLTLEGRPLGAKHVAIVGDFVVLSGLTDNPGTYPMVRN
jgi:hypothetical protein